MWCQLGWPNMNVTSPWLTGSESDITLVDPIWRWCHISLFDPILRWRHFGWLYLKKVSSLLLIQPKKLSRREKQPEGVFESRIIILHAWRIRRLHVLIEMIAVLFIWTPPLIIVDNIYMDTSCHWPFNGEFLCARQIHAAVKTGFQRTSSFWKKWTQCQSE